MHTEHFLCREDYYRGCRRLSPKDGVSLKVWAALYAMVWLVLLEFLVLMIAPGSLKGNAFWGASAAVWLHMVLGALIVAFAFVNAKNLAATAAPTRTKRVAKAIAGMSAAGAVLGALLYLDFTPGLGILQRGPVYVLHVLTAFAIITQAASVATSYDMWEEKEFEAAAPSPEAAARPEAPSTALY